MKKKTVKQSEMIFQLIVESAPSAMILVNKEGKIAYANKQAEKLFCYDRDDLIGQDVEVLIPKRFKTHHPDLRNMFFFSPQARSMGAGRELFAARKDGTEFPVEIGLNPVVTAEGTLVIASIIDITERRKFEEEKTLFASIINSTQDAIFSKNLDGIITSWNQGAEKVFGYSYEEIIGKHISILIPSHLQNEEQKIIIQIANDERVEHYETERIRKDGKVINVSLTISPIKDSQGKIVGASKISRDISERKESEQKIMKGNRLYSFLSQVNQSIVFIKEQQSLFNKICEIAFDLGKFKYAWIGMIDESTGKVTIVAQKGIADEDLPIYDNVNYKRIDYLHSPLGKAITTGAFTLTNDALNDPDMRDFKEQAEQRQFNSSILLPLKKSRKVVGLFCCTSSIINFFDKEEIALLIEAAGDISFALENFDKENDRLQALEQLKRNEERLNEAQGIALMGSWEVELKHDKHIWSDGFRAIYGIKKNEVPTLELFLSFIHPEDLDHANKTIGKAFVTLEESSFNFRFIRRDGVIRHGFSKSKFEFNKEGKPIRLYGIIQDITERKNAEEELKINNAELKKINAELDRFVYSISHELRSPIASMKGIFDLIQLDKLDDDDKGMMDFINRSIFKMDETLREILDYSRNSRNEIKSELIDLGKIIEDAFGNANYYKDFSFDKRINIETEVPFCSDMSRMKIVINNFISNALKYSKKDSKEPFIEINATINAEKLIMEIADNGIGIQAEVLPKIFGMFVRATEVASGSGLGLYIAKECAEKLGGTISVESELDKGTKFTIEIPNNKPVKN